MALHQNWRCAEIVLKRPPPPPLLFADKTCGSSKVPVAPAFWRSPLRRVMPAAVHRSVAPAHVLQFNRERRKNKTPKHLKKKRKKACHPNAK